MSFHLLYYILLTTTVEPNFTSSCRIDISLSKPLWLFGCFISLLIPNYSTIGPGYLSLYWRWHSSFAGQYETSGESRATLELDAVFTRGIFLRPIEGHLRPFCFLHGAETFLCGPNDFGIWYTDHIVKGTLLPVIN